MYMNSTQYMHIDDYQGSWKVLLPDFAYTATHGFAFNGDTVTTNCSTSMSYLDFTYFC